MSASGAIFDALEAIAETAIVGLSAERGLRLVDELHEGEFPHLFLSGAGDAPLETVELLTHLQERVTTTVSAILYTKGESQEATLAKADAIRAAIQANRTLSGAVTWSYVSETTLEEHAGEDFRAVALIVVAVKEP
ncbi:MAG: hypothetical protein L0221_05180 [Chloroflexi bacterium]|nr:hypothetical protein [Chloroflexota bacterium]